MLIFYLKQYYIDFEAIPIKTFETGRKQIKFQSRNKSENLIDNASMADRMYVFCFYELFIYFLFTLLIFEQFRLVSTTIYNCMQ